MRGEQRSCLESGAPLRRETRESGIWGFFYPSPFRLFFITLGAGVEFYLRRPFAPAPRANPPKTSQQPRSNPLKFQNQNTLLNLPDRAGARGLATTEGAPRAYSAGTGVRANARRRRGPCCTNQTALLVKRASLPARACGFWKKKARTLLCRKRGSPPLPALPHRHHGRPSLGHCGGESPDT